MALELFRRKMMETEESTTIELLEFIGTNEADGGEKKDTLLP